MLRFNPYVTCFLKNLKWSLKPRDSSQNSIQGLISFTSLLVLPIHCILLARNHDPVSHFRASSWICPCPPELCPWRVFNSVSFKTEHTCFFLNCAYLNSLDAFRALNINGSFSGLLLWTFSLSVSSYLHTCMCSYWTGVCILPAESSIRVSVIILFTHHPKEGLADTIEPWCVFVKVCTGVLSHNLGISQLCLDFSLLRKVVGLSDRAPALQSVSSVCIFKLNGKYCTLCKLCSRTFFRC